MGMFKDGATGWVSRWFTDGKVHLDAGCAGLAGTIDVERLNFSSLDDIMGRGRLFCRYCALAKVLQAVGLIKGDRSLVTFSGQGAVGSLVRVAREAPSLSSDQRMREVAGKLNMLWADTVAGVAAIGWWPNVGLELLSDNLLTFVLGCESLHAVTQCNRLYIENHGEKGDEIRRQLQLFWVLMSDRDQVDIGVVGYADLWDACYALVGQPLLSSGRGGDTRQLLRPSPTSRDG